ncbi:MAG: copper chaperone PCu(A)C [Acidimicrobiia bacterium]|nr:copper chaperone PCu(A)C [Acidimicrobiia bacterium]
MRMTLRALIAGAVLVSACSGGSGVIEVADSWAPSTPPNAPTAAIYLRVDNGTGDDDRLVDAELDRCTSIELHNTTIDEDRIMRMRLADPAALEIPSGGELLMEPAGLHVMCIGLDAPFREGETLELSLILESGIRLEAPTPVENR